MTTPLRIGWIGCGTHANEMLLPQLTRHDTVIQALCDMSTERLAATGRRYGVAPENQLTDWRALLARDDIDAVGLAVGPQLHYEIGLAAIARGLPIFIEKPPAPTARQAQELADAAEARGVPVVLGFMKRYSTANRIAANVIHSDEFGATASFLGQYMTAPTYFAKDVDYTGFYLHHCVHYFDLVPHLMGDVADISARRHEIEPGKLLLHVDFRFVNGGIGTLVMGTHQSRGTPMEWWQVMGDHRRVEVRNVHEVRYYRNPPFKVAKLDASLVDGEDTLVWEPNLTAAANEDHKGYHALLGEFIRAARGERVPVPNAADGARAMALLEKAIG
ncbi:Gfo/Idh/MocA family protein [Chelatococcus asaccharovorans]|uniref:Gfo/Idh/MocA family protein n=1 Tax=Chelatococcus asaccharovorans TaxID=28210 RepID=UPI00224C6D3B|nr:Gfo/Idh/MocA family oxidoreductase [Chelatococcus asaccharovorans]CAH1649029.1 Myo-inositol 2-dehydrogenase/D-chiro-inositol 1-dehydrogenase [Chelatococcus asaccharovorans]CAH1691265.1 Myo-inositol 2-dehydrogenase/D-chiro-inositol 1-dehydrogenase [Chelatococcus asaccharovorans]